MSIDGGEIAPRAPTDEPSSGSVAPDKGLPKLERASVRTAHASVTERLRTAIITGRLAAGTRLVQSDLASMLSVSITPVREALRELTTEGLVDFDAFRGAIVHIPSREEMLDIYEVRRALVGLNVRKGVTNITPEGLQDAEHYAAAMESADAETWVELNRQFHDVLDTASGNAHLAATLSRLAILSGLYVNLCIGLGDTFRSRAGSEHRQLLAAYRSGDVERAIDINLQHLEATVATAEAAAPPEFHPAPARLRSRTMIGLR